MSAGACPDGTRFASRAYREQRRQTVAFVLVEACVPKPALSSKGQFPAKDGTTPDPLDRLGPLAAEEIGYTSATCQNVDAELVDGLGLYWPLRTTRT